MGSSYTFIRSFHSIRVNKIYELKDSITVIFITNTKLDTLLFILGTYHCNYFFLVFFAINIMYIDSFNSNFLEVNWN